MLTTPTQRILLVDDEQALLDALCRQHRKQYELVPACGPQAALGELTAPGRFAAVVADYQMPGMNGIEFLARAQDIDPDMIRIMLTGQADLRLAIEAVNRGRIFRFLTKPCEAELLRGCLDAALEQHGLRQAERFLLEHTLKGSIEVLVELLSLANPSAFSRATRVRRYVAHVVAKLGLRDGWQFETAALLSQIGCVAIPNDVLERMASGEPLSPEQNAMIERHPELARDLLRKIPRLQVVADIVRAQGGTSPDEGGQTPAAVKIGGRVLCAALAFEELVSVGAAPQQALEALRAEHGRHDPRILDALADADVAGAAEIRRLPLRRLEVGMTLLEDVFNVNGALIVGRGHEITESSLERLRNYLNLRLTTKRDFHVRVPARSKPAADVHAA